MAAAAGGKDGAFNERILEGLRPNFFELLSQEAMHEALRPAIRYVIKTLAQNRPDWFARVWSFSDEIYLVLESLLQLHFLRNHEASFAECFYSLKRTPSTSRTRAGGGGGRSDRETVLGRRDRVASILCLVAVPYLKVKLDQLYLKLQEIDDATPLTWWRGCATKQLLAVAFFRLYPYFLSLWEALKFLFRLLYLFRKTEFYTPLLYLTGLCLSRTPDDPAALLGGGTRGEGLFQWLTSNLLPLGMFSLKFLEWWYSTERTTTVRMMTSLPVPPPPGRIKAHPGNIQAPPHPTLCPLCSRERTHPTTLSTSGYVFCYSCIHDYVGEHGECPITCLPSSRQQLIRLFLQKQ